MKKLRIKARSLLHEALKRRWILKILAEQELNKKQEAKMPRRHLLKR